MTCKQRMSATPKGSTPGLLQRTNSLSLSLHPTTSPQTAASALKHQEAVNLSSCPRRPSRTSGSLATGATPPNNAANGQDEKSFHDASSSPTQDAIKADPSSYPEGGLCAWLVVLGSFSAMVAGFGYMNSIATFQAYLTTHQLQDYSEQTVGWVFSVYVFLSFFAGIQIGPVFDRHGPRWIIVAGTVCLILSAFLMGECTSESSSNGSMRS